jgi:hypothetical protein
MDIAAATVEVDMPTADAAATVTQGAVMPAVVPADMRVVRREDTLAVELPGAMPAAVQHEDTLAAVVPAVIPAAAQRVDIVAAAHAAAAVEAAAAVASMVEAVEAAAAVVVAAADTDNRRLICNKKPVCFGRRAFSLRSLTC